MTSSPAHAAAERLVSVQILRGVAALLVVALHLNVSLHDIEGRIGRSAIANFASWYEFGGIGVDLFFLISGFVMAFTMSQYAGRAGSFMRQRFLRIAPLCYVVSGVWILILVLADRPLSAAGIFSGITFLPILPTYTEPTFRVLWTLSFEFAFYMLVFLTLSLRLGPKHLFFITCAAGTFGFAVNLPLPLMRWLTHPVLLEFCLGIAAFLMWENRIWSRQSLRIGASVGAALLVSEALWLPLIETNPTWVIEGLSVGRRLIFWCVPAFFLLNFLLEWKPSPSRTTRAAQAVGDASYSIYLTHLIAVYAITEFVPLPPDARWLLGFICSVLLGLAVYRWVERPLVRVLVHRSPTSRGIARPTSISNAARQ